MASVLIVDDSTMVRRNLRIILEEAGFTIANECSSGREALVSYRVNKPDIVTMDISMDDIDGVTVMKRILEDFPEARIVMVSAQGQKSTVYEAMKSGAKSFIVKPFDKEKVVEILTSVLNEE